MKKVLLLLSFSFMALMLNAQNTPVFEVRVDSFVNQTAYFQLVRYIPDTLNMSYSIDDYQTNILGYNQAIKFTQNQLTAIEESYTDTTYTDPFKETIEDQWRQQKNQLNQYLMSRLELVAIRDSVISFINE